MHLMRRLVLVIVFIMAGAVLVPDSALADNNGARWNSLDPDEQSILKRHAQRWQNYSFEKKQTLKQSARRFQGMSPAQKNRVKKRARTFRQLSVEDRQEACQRYFQQHGRLPPVCLR